MLRAPDTGAVTLTLTCLCLLTQTNASGHQQVLPGQAAAREVKEESGILVDPADLQEMAEVTFRFPARPKWDQTVSVFTTPDWAGEPGESTEITPQWFPVTQLPLDDMWDDARYWLPHVLAGQRINATITYADDCQTVTRANLDLPPGFVMRGRGY